MNAAGRCPEQPGEAGGEGEPAGGEIREGLGHAGRDDESRAFRLALPGVLMTTGIFFLTYLIRVIFGPLLPEFEREFGISHAASTRLLMYISAGYSLAVFLSCFLASRIAPRRLAAASAILGGVTLIGIAATTNPTLLPFMFLLLGIVTGPYLNAGFSILRSLGPEALWGRFIAAHECAPNAGLLLAPLIAGAGSALLGRQGTLYGLGALCIAAGALFVFRCRGGVRTDPPVSLAGFGQALREPGLLFFVFALGLAISAHFGIYSVLTLYMEDELGIPAEQAALLLSTSRIAAPFAAYAAGRFCARMGTRATMLFAFSLMAAAVVCLALPSFPAFIVGLYVHPLCAALAIPTAFTHLAYAFPKDMPLYMAIGVPIGSYIGLGVTPMLLGLWGDYAGFTAGFLMTACLMLAFLPVILLTGRPGPGLRA
ncbi:MAG: MFS transporter [Desulfovibrio sp.]|jgi:NNP family nitrate/nitrite transporter-like MFS transporter|nr:MFS transporter [Desulfovibrio sp.]